MAIALSKTYTSNEYLALELEAETRSEYRNGEIVLMTGGTPAHNEIIGDLMFVLKASLKGQSYSIFVTDQRLWNPARKIYTYPDVMIAPRPIALQIGRKDTVTNPILIAEVLSDSTKAYDRGEKFSAYQAIATLQEYLLIDQYQPFIEHYIRQNTNQWLCAEYYGKEARFKLSSVAVEIALADIYLNVDV